MKILIDTNVIIDILEQRAPFFEDSYTVLQLALQGKLNALMSAGAVTDVYYIIKKSIRDAKKAKDKILALKALVTICDTTAHDIDTALSLNIIDFEDAVVSAVSIRERVDYIVTRNEKDFGNSPVPAISPNQFLHLYNNL